MTSVMHHFYSSALFQSDGRPLHYSPFALPNPTRRLLPVPAVNSNKRDFAQGGANAKAPHHIVASKKRSSGPVKLTFLTRDNYEVVKYCLNSGRVLATFNDSVEAAEDVGAHKVSISRVCRGKRQSLKGFGWRYREKPKRVSNNSECHHRPTAQKMSKATSTSSTSSPSDDLLMGFLYNDNVYNAMTDAKRNEKTPNDHIVPTIDINAPAQVPSSSPGIDGAGDESVIITRNETKPVSSSSKNTSAIHTPVDSTSIPITPLSLLAMVSNIRLSYESGNLNMRDFERKNVLPPSNSQVLNMPTLPCNLTMPHSEQHMTIPSKRVSPKSAMGSSIKKAAVSVASLSNNPSVSHKSGVSTNFCAKKCVHRLPRATAKKSISIASLSQPSSAFHKSGMSFNKSLVHNRLPPNESTKKAINKFAAASPTTRTTTAKKRPAQVFSNSGVQFTAESLVRRLVPARATATTTTTTTAQAETTTTPTPAAAAASTKPPQIFHNSGVSYTKLLAHSLPLATAKSRYGRLLTIQHYKRSKTKPSTTSSSNKNKVAAASISPATSSGSQTSSS
jgi:hypothetical protein